MRWSVAGYLVLSIPIAIWLLPTGREKPPVDFPEPHKTIDRTTTAEMRERALRQARVWVAPARKIALGANPPDPTGTLSDPIVRCEYVPASPHGTTPKFDCVLRDGEVVKVKYGYTAEIFTEVAATRLLTALGFGADRMYLLPHLRCYGCVRTPFFTMWVLDLVHMRERFTHTIPSDRFTDFNWVAVERRFDQREIKTDDQEGWAWFELDEIDPGANRAERDALRLAAVLLAHWDNKPENQRLVCLSGDVGEVGEVDACRRPFAYIHDLGATFGPNKLDFDGWKSSPIWNDRSTCTVSMRRFPYDGGTFRDVRISEAGRQLLVRQLVPFEDSEIARLFAAARFDQFHGVGKVHASIDAWTAAFRAKVREISDAGPCEVQ